MRAMETAFVTGGSGFVGQAVIKRLVSHGAKVRALARSERAAAIVADAGAEPVRGDVTDVASLAAGARGCDVAIHAAAKVDTWGRWEDFERVNVLGTANVLAGCRQGSVRRFVHVGTEAALVDGNALVNADETWPLRPNSAAFYPRSKARAEQLVVAASNGEMDTIVIRPRLVWGPGDATFLPAAAEMVEAGRFVWLGGGHHLTSTAHIDNVVTALLLAAGADAPAGGRAYFVTDGSPVEFRAFVTALLESIGVQPPTRSVPVPVARAAAVAIETTWRAMRLQGRPPLTRLAVWNAALECTVNDARAHQELGYVPVISREEGLRRLMSAD